MMASFRYQNAIKMVVIAGLPQMKTLFARIPIGFICHIIAFNNALKGSMRK